MSSLSLQGVTKSFGKTPVLTGIDLEVPSASFTALLGPSGCGKTTLLRLIAGFDDPDSGRILIGDNEVVGPGRRMAAHRRGVGIVAQDGGLFPHLNVAANIAFGLPRRQRRDRGRIRELLDLVGLDADLTERSPHQLSGGQQQRVALARALAPEPLLVLLDEPFTSLDASLREETRQAVADAVKVSGATTVLVTHDQSEALSMADQAAVLRGGQLVQHADPRTLYRSPRDLDVATFVGEVVILDADIRDGRARTALGTHCLERACPDGRARILLRPEQLRLAAAQAPPDGGPLAGDSALARVRRIDFYGHDSRVWLDLSSGQSVKARVEGLDLPIVGQQVTITVTGAALPLASSVIDLGTFASGALP